MTIKVKIPTPLRNLTEGKDEVSAEGNTVNEVLNNLDSSYSGIRERVCDDKGVRRFINVYANEEDIRFLEGLETPLKDGDSLSIVPAIAGGVSEPRPTQLG